MCVLGDIPVMLRRNIPVTLREVVKTSALFGISKTHPALIRHFYFYFKRGGREMGKASRTFIDKHINVYIFFSNVSI